MPRLLITLLCGAMLASCATSQAQYDAAVVNPATTSVTPVCT
jgi:hypothetical protein